MTSRITTKVYIKANSINKPKKMIQNFTLTRAETLKTSNQDQLYLEWVIGKQHFFVFILKTAWKRVKSVLNFENEKNVLLNLKTFFFYAFWNFLKSFFFLCVSKFENRSEIFHNDFWKNTFCPTLPL